VARPPANSEAAISRPISLATSGRLAEDQRHRDAAIHGQDVLQAVGQVGTDSEILVFRALPGGRYS
jgi:hypothetical protein